MIIGARNPIKLLTIDIKKAEIFVSIKNDANGGPTITQEINPDKKSISAKINLLVFLLKPMKLIEPKLLNCFIESGNHG